MDPRYLVWGPACVHILFGWWIGCNFESFRLKQEPSLRVEISVLNYTLPTLKLRLLRTGKRLFPKIPNERHEYTRFQVQSSTCRLDELGFFSRIVYVENPNPEKSSATTLHKKNPSTSDLEKRKRSGRFEFKMQVQMDYGADDPFWIDEAWLDTVVVVGLTCFILCLMNLSKVRSLPSCQLVNHKRYQDTPMIKLTFSSNILSGPYI